MGIGKKKQGTEQEKKESQKNTSKIGVGKFWAWNSRAVSTTINTLILGYVTFYGTNQLMLSPLVVGIVLMASRITDGVTDLFAGFIVDRTRTKLGKGRPYEICILGLWACTLLLYSCPENLSTVLKYVWVFVMYFFVQSVFFTLLSAADIVYMVRAFRDEKQYATLNSMSGIIISAAGWLTMIAIWAIPCALIGIFRFFFVKETRDVDYETKNQKFELKDIGTLLKSNHHIYPVAIAILVTSFPANMGVGVYYYTYIIRDVGKMALSAVASVACLPVLFVFPKLVGKMKVKDWCAERAAPHRQMPFRRSFRTSGPTCRWTKPWRGSLRWQGGALPARSGWEMPTTGCIRDLGARWKRLAPVFPPSR